ncbi:Carboxylic ester hydrolase [Meloidogyne graminicola]|uniref:Carboxylic ester hydrolase n=1 Tax=Meloidogyne graminicola TaxID=189291 RepID=A0A8S9ZQE2_9BILA|nr:Carboxylic ester hydrolase [Meloidogyne graminicola]
MRRYKDFVDIGRKYLSKGIIVIAVQFRIGFLGFSSLGDSHIPGNFGYWDITEALNWIKTNIKAFGGDPERITLFGYSAGSTAITTLGVSPYSKDLFQQSIQMSGSIFTSRAANDRVISISNNLFSLLGCMSNETKNIKDCLKTKDIEEFFDAMDIIGSTIPDVNYDIFGPILDKDFLPNDFNELISLTKPKPTILGITEMDPLGYILFLGNNSLRHLCIPKEELPNFGIFQFKNYLKQKVIKNEYFGNFSELVIEHISNFYLNYERPEILNNWFYLERIIYLMTDIQFIVPLATEIKNKQGWPLFIYINKFINNKLFPTNIKIKKNFHDNDHRYVFRNPYSNYQYDENDLKMESLMTDFISNFVIYG